jgi:hypothetical protein
MFLKVTTKTNWDTKETYLLLTKIGGTTKSITQPFKPYLYTALLSWR